ncbi:MAG: Gfo/Idh/MocA family oxidoreductase [Candidatus Omnitrophota bacterium]
MKKYKAAIIGCGRIGSEFGDKSDKKNICSHTGAYFHNPGTEVVTVCDANKEKLNACKRKWGINSVYTDYARMLRNEEIDILSIATPADTHYSIIKEASKFPVKAIYCEKPISNKVESAEKAVKICKDKKILLFINHQRSFSPFYRELQKKLRNGSLGEVQQVNCYYTRGILNTGTHIVDLLFFLLGSSEWVFSAFSRNKSPFETDPNLDTMIKFKSGPIATLKPCDDSCYLILELEILTTLCLIRLGKELEYFKAVSGKNLLRAKELVRSERYPFRFAYAAPSLSHAVEHIIKCLRKKEKPLSSGEHATHTLAVIQAMLASANQGKKKFVD